MLGKKQKRRQLTIRVLLPILGVFALFCSAISPTCAQAATIFVKADAAGIATGASWADAYTSLQDGLAAAVSGDEIWVAAGDYVPGPGSSFTLQGNIISLYGGFNGTETTPSQRNWQLNKTVMRGNASSDRVFKVANVQDLLIDGVTITGGSCIGSPSCGGSAILLNATNAVIRNSLFTHNSTDGYGGAINSGSSHLTVSDCAFIDNRADGYYENPCSGGAIGTFNLDYPVIVERCFFRGNTAGWAGGAIYGPVTVTDSVFLDNSAEWGGGAVCGHRNITVTNSLFLRNHANKEGGAISHRFGLLNINHATFAWNTAGSGGALFLVNYDLAVEDITIANSILWNNIAPTGMGTAINAGLSSFNDGPLSVTILSSILEGGPLAIAVGANTLLTYTNNSENDPLLLANGHLQAGSPCIDAGVANAAITTDIDGEPRPTGAAVDIGADEFVDTDGDGLPDFWERLHGLDPNDNGASDPKNGANGDPDGDGYTNLAEYASGTSPIERTDMDGDGFTPAEGDCNDQDAAINPAASESCDGIDNNCNGLIDDGYDLDGDGYTSCNGDCDDTNAAVHPGVTEICGDGIDNDCSGIIDSNYECNPLPCLYDAQCGAAEYCKKTAGNCGGVGSCQPFSAVQCPAMVEPVCGCDGKTYPNACEADLSGVNVASTGECATTSYRWTYYFPSIKDNDAIGWENYLSVQAKNPVPMEVTIRVYDMAGTLKGTYIYSNTTAGANGPAITPNARVAQRPGWIVGSESAPLAIEGSMIVETSVPAIASTNCIANFYKGFSIHEAAKVRPVHYFPKAFDGPNNYQVYMLVQNIYESPRNVTVKLFGKNVGDPGDGATKTVNIPAHATLKVRPSEIAGGIDFNGSVVVYSNLITPKDGLGLPVPAMCRYEAGAEALAIYESTARQPRLAFPVLKDGKFGGSLDYQNFLSVVNMNPTDATVTVILYNKAGVEEGRLANDIIPSGGKKTWRPGWIKGTLAAPADFEGSAVVLSDKILVGQTNTIYPGNNQYGADAFDLIESAMPTPSLVFPKAFDNLMGSGTGAAHLIDNVVYIQNLDETVKNLKIEQFNNNGAANGYAEVTLAPNATHVFRPKDLVTDSTGGFRGSVRVTERNGRKITGAIKYEVHKTTVATSGIEAMSIYRSMGQ